MENIIAVMYRRVFIPMNIKFYTFIVVFFLLNANSIALANSNYNSQATLQKILDSNVAPIDLVYRRTHSKEDLIKKLRAYLLGAGISLEEFKHLHYNRNQFQKSVLNIDDIYDVERNTGKHGFKKLDADKTIFHQIGDNQKNNIKIVSKDGKSEYIFSFDPVSASYSLVTDEVNKGTYNIFSPHGGILRKGTKHVVWDVLPWIIWGNSEDDSTTFEYRSTLNQLGSVIHGGRKYHRGTYTETEARDSLNFWLKNCRCEHDTSWLAGQQSEFPSALPHDVNNEDNYLSDDFKNDIIDDAREKKEDSKENWLGSVTGLDQSPASIFSVTTFGYTESALLHPNVNDVISIEVLDPASNTGQRLGTVQGRINGKYDHTAWGEWNGKLIAVNHGTGLPTEFERGLFVVGSPTPKSDIDRRIGNAEFTGQIHGDYASQDDGLIANSVTGTIDLTVNFDNHSVSGIIGMLGPNGFSANPQFNANFYDKGPNAVGYNGNLIGANGNGGIDGTFFGKNGEETGGSFHYFKNTGENGTGIFIAKEKK